MVSTFKPPVRPRQGICVNVSFPIGLWPEPPSPGVRLALDDLTAVFSRADLVALADPGPAPPPWQRDDRPSQWQSYRAAALLGFADRQLPPRPGELVSLPEDFEVELGYLLVDLLEAGKAHIIDTATGAVVPEILIRYFGRRAGPLAGYGDISFRQEDRGYPFLKSSWWVA